MQPPVQMALPVNSRDLADVDTVLDRAIRAGDPLIATEYGNQLTNTIRLKGVALAKLLFGLKSNWALFQAAGIQEGFAPFVDANMRIAGRTADKYADMYGEVLANESIPVYIREELKLKPIQTLLLLTASVREGSLDEEDLADVVLLDHNGVRSLVRERRGDATNSHTSVYGRLMKDSSVYPPGTIVAFGGADVEAIGYLKADPTTDAGRKLVARIVNKLNLEGSSHDSPE